jgi:ectoine hydroxylase-related dioxygenase (phytanoyl-CoA dioxygenase family)
MAPVLTADEQVATLVTTGPTEERAVEYAVPEATQTEAFEAVGAVALRSALGHEWIDLLKDATPELVAHVYNSTERLETDRNESYSRHGMWRDCEPFARFLFNSPVGSLAAAYMRSDTVRLYEDLFLYKALDGDGNTEWHRDAPHWPIMGNQMCSVWFSLESVGHDNGSMSFVAGSHRDGEDRVDPRAITLSDSELADRPVVSIETEPGDVIVFHPRVIHMVRSSVVERPRYSFTIRLVGDDVRWRPRRSFYHPWMAGCGLARGDTLDHPWFPVVPSGS